jgi:hypothetical protein
MYNNFYYKWISLPNKITTCLSPSYYSLNTHYEFKKFIILQNEFGIKLFNNFTVINDKISLKCSINMNEISKFCLF